MKTTDYVIMQEFHYSFDQHDSITLVTGSFVRPMDPRWVPNFIKQRNTFFNDKIEVYCYTRYGIIPVPLKLIRIAE